jgi:uncharacterized SAM-binding protein YcdF (DUF218 family)
MARQRVRRRRWGLLALLLCLMAALGWSAWVAGQIRYYEQRDDARAADAIAVFGAAEYEGRPSPVLRARLDHAFALYQRGLAPLIITLGGPGDAQHSEGGVGRDYLQTLGVPPARIIAETHSLNTAQSARRLAGIARANRLSSIILVSDGSHLFRMREMCRAEGLTVYLSPRPQARPLPLAESLRRGLHEVASYTAWRLHL